MRFPAIVAAILLLAGLSAGRAEASLADTTCMLVRSDHRAEALVLNRGGTVTLSGCGITINSDHSKAAVFNRGGILDTTRLCAPGGVRDLGGTFPKPAAGCRPQRDFLAKRYTPPKPARCLARSTNYKTGVHVLKPGTYCGWHYFEPGSRVKLKPGVYVIRGGGWILGGTFRARGVSLHLHDRSIVQFNPGADVTLTAPLKGPMKGFAISERHRDRNRHKRSWIAVNAVDRLFIRGFVHLPTRDLVFNRESKLYARRSAIVVDRIRINEGRISIRRD